MTGRRSGIIRSGVSVRTKPPFTLWVQVTTTIAAIPVITRKQNYVNGWARVAADDGTSHSKY
jgi:hypothetical protein